MTLWLVRAVAWYPRYCDDEEMYDRPKRPSPTLPRRWCDTTRAGPSRNYTVPVEAETKAEAEQKVLDDGRFEKLRDKPTTRMETVK